MYPVLRKRRSSPQDGETSGFRSGRCRSEQELENTEQSGRITGCLGAALLSVTDPRESVSRRGLPTAKLSEDEACSEPLKVLQEECQRWMSYLQAADSALLFPRQTMYGSQVCRTILHQHQAEAQAATEHNKRSHGSSSIAVEQPS